MDKLKAKIVNLLRKLLKQIILYTISIYEEHQKLQLKSPQETKPSINKSVNADVDSVIVYLCLVCHWTFSEACRFITETPIRKVRTFMAELQYQKSVANYQIAANSAMVICTWANAQKKGNRFKVSDFIGQLPQRSNAKSKLKEASEKAGIKLPKGDI